jgi:hypothetical protein
MEVPLCHPVRMGSPSLALHIYVDAELVLLVCRPWFHLPPLASLSARVLLLGFSCGLQLSLLLAHLGPFVPVSVLCRPTPVRSGSLLNDSRAMLYCPQFRKYLSSAFKSDDTVTLIGAHGQLVPFLQSPVAPSS